MYIPKDVYTLAVVVLDEYCVCACVYVYGLCLYLLQAGKEPFPCPASLFLKDLACYLIDNGTCTLYLVYTYAHKLSSSLSCSDFAAHTVASAYFCTGVVISSGFCLPLRPP